MKTFKRVLMPGLLLMLFTSCTQEELKSDTSLKRNDIPVKSTSCQQLSGNQYQTVPFRATLQLTAYFNQLGLVRQLDYQNPYVIPPKVEGLFLDIEGCGNATQLGCLYFELEQWWAAWPDPDNQIRTGQAKITFRTPNGDLLFGTFYGTADYSKEPPAEIKAYGVFTGGKGEFLNAKGTFEWNALFTRDNLSPDQELVAGDVIGTGSAVVKGSIQY